MYKGSFAKELVDKWQSMVDLMAEVFHMSVGFIVCQRPNGIEILIANTDSKYPFQAGTRLADNINSFLFSVNPGEQTGVAEQHAASEEVEDIVRIQPEQFNTRIGLPICGADGAPFGAICVMDHQPIETGTYHLNLLNHFKSISEQDLKLLDRLQSITDLSLKDDLTGVYNRRGFNVLSQKQYFYGKRSHIKFAFMIADIDRLKQINDNYGHKTGDHAIVTLADALMNSFRECDLVARVGGDEFYIALNLNQDDEIERIVSRAESYLENHPIASGIVTFSWGVSIRHYSNAITLSLEDLIDEADKMLYQNKKKNLKKKVSTTY